MAYDKVVDSAALDTQLTSIADAIRAKTGGSDSLVFPDGFSQAIAAIEAGGGGGNFTTGEFTLASSTAKYILAEDIDDPTFVAIYKVENITDGDYSFVILAYLKTGGKYYHVGLRNTPDYTAIKEVYTSNITSGSMYWSGRKIVVSSFAYSMVAGTYKYIII